MAAMVVNKVSLSLSLSLSLYLTVECYGQLMEDGAM